MTWQKYKKSEKHTPFGVIFHVRELFPQKNNSGIPSTDGGRGTPRPYDPSDGKRRLNAIQNPFQSVKSASSAFPVFAKIYVQYAKMRVTRGIAPTRKNGSVDDWGGLCCRYADKL